jgi:hypothetical protein
VLHSRIGPLASPTNIRLGWKGLPGTNTLAYFKNPKITTVKSFIVKTLGLDYREGAMTISKMTFSRMTLGIPIKALHLF